MEVQIIKSGAKNLSVLVKGFCSKDFLRTPILDLSKTDPESKFKGLRLDSAVWAIQEKMGFYLWWDDVDDEKSIALVMESRNGMRFDEGIPSPRVEDGWGGKLYLSSFKQSEPWPGRKAFFVLLDFDKQ